MLVCLIACLTKRFCSAQIKRNDSFLYSFIYFVLTYPSFIQIRILNFRNICIKGITRNPHRCQCHFDCTLQSTQFLLLTLHLSPKPFSSCSCWLFQAFSCLDLVQHRTQVPLEVFFIAKRFPPWSFAFGQVLSSDIGQGLRSFSF